MQLRIFLGYLVTGMSVWWRQKLTPCHNECGGADVIMRWLCRFSGEEQLTCNCGAPSCRGRVNWRCPDDETSLLVPASKLRRPKPADFPVP